MTRVLLVITLIVTPCAAQEQHALAPLETINLDRQINTPGGRAEINAGQDSSSAAISIAHTISRPKTSRFDSWSLIAKAPLNKNDKNTALATLDGFANAFSVSFKYTWFYGNDRLTAVDTEKAQEICNEMTPNYKATGKTDEPECDMNNVKTHYKQRWDEFKLLYWDPNKKTTVWGIEATAGYQDFEYFSNEDSEATSTSKTPYGASIYLGRTIKNSSALIAAGIEYQRGYKHADEKTVCDEQEDNNLLSCETKPFGEPLENNKELVFIELRKLWKGIGLAPKLTYDLNEDNYGIDLPVYLLSDKKNALRGGVRLAWNNQDHLQAGVFVGSSFSLFR